MTAYVRRINHVLINVHKIFVIISTMYQYLKLYKIILFSDYKIVNFYARFTSMPDRLDQGKENIKWTGFITVKTKLDGINIHVA